MRREGEGEKERLVGEGGRDRKERDDEREGEEGRGWGERKTMRGEGTLLGQ